MHVLLQQGQLITEVQQTQLTDTCSHSSAVPKINKQTKQKNSVLYTPSSFLSPISCTICIKSHKMHFCAPSSILTRHPMFLLLLFLKYIFKYSKSFPFLWKITHNLCPSAFLKIIITQHLLINAGHFTCMFTKVCSNNHSLPLGGLDSNLSSLLQNCGFSSY